MIHKYPKTETVEFIFDHLSDETPHLVGDWDGWSLPGTPMSAEKGKWVARLRLGPGDHQFKYRVGERWYNDFFADHYVDNGLGGDNSVVTVQTQPPKPARRSTGRAPRRSSSSKGH
jgi:hypothetical protein